MAVNKEPFVRSRSKDGLPHVFRGVVQAGSTQAIKRGEILCYGATTGYWTPVTLAAHYVYPLAIAKEEQKAADLERYIELYSLHPDDEFEFALDAARSLALGDTFILTASDSQSLTYSASAFPVARCVDDGHYPETGTTIRNRSYAVVRFNIAVSAWGLMISGDGLGTPKGPVTLAAVTLLKEQSGLEITNNALTGSRTHVLPQACPAGTNFKAICSAAQGIYFDPGAAGAILIQGAKQTDDKYAGIDAIGDALKLVADGNGDWLAELMLSSDNAITGAITLE